MSIAASYQKCGSPHQGSHRVVPRKRILWRWGITLSPPVETTAGRLAARAVLVRLRRESGRVDRIDRRMFDFAEPRSLLVPGCSSSTIVEPPDFDGHRISREISRDGGGGGAPGRGDQLRPGGEKPPGPPWSGEEASSWPQGINRSAVSFDAPPARVLCFARANTDNQIAPAVGLSWPTGPLDR